MTVGGDAERGGEKKKGGPPLNYSVPPTVTHKHKGTHFFFFLGPNGRLGLLVGGSVSPARCSLPWTPRIPPEPHKTAGTTPPTPQKPPPPPQCEYQIFHLGSGG